MSDRIYRIYCSKCNKDRKKKMSWKKYFYYMTADGKSKGHHDIDSSFITNSIGQPTKCPFGHTTIRLIKIINSSIPQPELPAFYTDSE